jgi:hypothetical protein
MAARRRDPAPTAFATLFLSLDEHETPGASTAFRTGCRRDNKECERDRAAQPVVCNRRGAVRTSALLKRPPDAGIRTGVVRGQQARELDRFTRL